ncbi:hypothetical protein ACN6A1_28045 [Myxococcus virescens]|uniref:hypothetical protein n=1 Tax=Myxococcus virescens TaxID=83456 RepID=UPI003DA65F58
MANQTATVGLKERLTLMLSFPEEGTAAAYSVGIYSPIPGQKDRWAFEQDLATNEYYPDARIDAFEFAAPAEANTRYLIYITAEMSSVNAQASLVMKGAIHRGAITGEVIVESETQSQISQGGKVAVELRLYVET